MIKKLQQINNSIIEKNLNNNEIVKKHNLIKKLLEEENCFLKMSIEQAYSILKDLQIDSNDIKDIYCLMIDPK